MSTTLFLKHGRAMAAGELRGEPRGRSKCLVEVNGYISMRQQIKRAAEAGLRLEEYRKSIYTHPSADYFNEDALSPLDDPDFMPSVDMPAVMAYAEEIKKRKAALKKDAASFPAASKDEGAPHTKEAVATEDAGAAE